MSDGQTGLETQDKLCNTWADNNGHSIVHTAADRHTGNSHPWNRKNLRPWVTDPELIAQYDGIIAYRLDRLSRGDDESTSAIEQWARDNGKVLLTEDGLIYPCEGADGIRWDVTKRIAHEEWLKTSERYKRMQSHLRDNNFLVGRPPYGFRVTEKDNHKTLTPDPVTGPVLREAIDRYLAGASLRDVCLWLGDGWTPVTLSQLFRNESLIGRRKARNGSKTLLKHDPLINRDTWDKLQAMLAGKANRKGVAPKSTAMLTSIAVCSVCGGPMYRLNAGNKRADGTRSTILYYRCHGNDRNPSQCKLMVSLPELDAFVSQQIDGIYGHHPVYELVTVPGDGREDEIAELERDIRELDLDDPDYDRKLSQLRTERSRLKTLPAAPGRTEKRATGRTMRQEWAELDSDAERRDWLLKRAIKVEVHKPVSDSRIMLDSQYEIELLPIPGR